MTLTRPHPRLDLLLIVLLLIRGLLGIAYSLATPLGEAPDEADHFAYTAYIVEHGRLPVGPEITQGKHPPLYYLTAALAGKLAGGTGDRSFLRANPDMAFGSDSLAPNFFVHTSLEYPPWRDGVLTLRAGRFVSILAGLVLVLATYLLGRALWPTQRAIAFGGAAFAAFLPESLFIGGAMSNDMFAAMWAALALLGTARLLRDSRVLSALLTGLCLGFAFVSKASTGSLALVLVAALLVQAWRARKSFASAIAPVLLIGLAALVVAAPWLWRNWRLYGDPFGWSLVLATIDRRTTPLGVADVAQLLRGWWLSFWGKFGGAGHIPLPRGFYVLWAALGLAAFAGWVLRIRERSDRHALREPGIGGWTLLAGAPLVTAVGIYSYSQTALGTDQGRLLFPALAPLSLLIFAGVVGWFAPKHRYIGACSFAGILGVLAVAALVRGLVAPFAPSGPPAAAELAAAEVVGVSFGPLTLLSAAWDTPRPGQLTLYWAATEKTTQDLRTGVTFFDAAGHRVWEWKRSPGAGRFSTDLWLPGRIIADTYRIPPDLAPRVASAQIGLRPFPEGPWLPVGGQPAEPLLTLPR